MHLEEVRIISLFYILFSNEMITVRGKEKNIKIMVKIKIKITDFIKYT